MSSIIVPPSAKEKKTKNVNMDELKYQATEEDEKDFILMYGLNLQPSELVSMDKDKKEWLLHRFMYQKHMEQEMMQQSQLMNRIGPNLKV